MFVFYSLLYRFALLPRALAAFGLITVMLHFTGITLPLFPDDSSVTLLGVPMALSHIAPALWMMRVWRNAIAHFMPKHTASNSPERRTRRYSFR